jgi:hypothetical protein
MTKFQHRSVRLLGLTAILVLNKTIFYSVGSTDLVKTHTEFVARRFRFHTSVIGRMEGMENLCKIRITEFEENTSHSKFNRRWDDNIKIDLLDMGTRM